MTWSHPVPGPVQDRLDAWREYAGKVARGVCPHLTGAPQVLYGHLTLPRYVFCHGCAREVARAHDELYPDTSDACGQVVEDNTFDGLLHAVQGSPLVLLGEVCMSSHEIHNADRPSDQ